MLTRLILGLINFPGVSQELTENKACINDLKRTKKASKGSYWRLMKLNAPEWPYAVLGSIGSILMGTVHPIIALFLSDLINVYYEADKDKMKREVQKYVMAYVGIAVASLGILVLQHYYFGIVGENLTARVRETMFKGDSSALFQLSTDALGLSVSC